MTETLGPPMDGAMFTRVMDESILLNIPMEEVCRRALENYFFLKEQSRKGNKIIVVDSNENKIKDMVYQNSSA